MWKDQKVEGHNAPHPSGKGQTCHHNSLSFGRTNNSCHHIMELLILTSLLAVAQKWQNCVSQCVFCMLKLWWNNIVTSSHMFKILLCVSFTMTRDTPVNKVHLVQWANFLHKIWYEVWQALDCAILQEIPPLRVVIWNNSEDKLHHSALRWAHMSLHWLQRNSTMCFRTCHKKSIASFLFLPFSPERPFSVSSCNERSYCKHACAMMQPKFHAKNYQRTTCGQHLPLNGTSFSLKQACDKAATGASRFKHSTVNILVAWWSDWRLYD